ncbi:hypothetical protein ACFWB1_03925 [Streptomyces goshikiensis]|uniref:hypothetical protein n=1 Tax=Streptomyces goshikiensis TaxID=1942 RepID=UPI0036A3481C
MIISPAILLLFALAASFLLSMIIGGVATALVRWDGASLPTALTRGGVAFGGTLTLCCAVIAILLGTGR